MNGFTRTPSRFRARLVLCLGSILMGSIGGSNPLYGSAIHGHHETAAVDAAAHRSWSEYLMSGPSVWSAVAHPALTPSIEAKMWQSIKNDPPPVTSAVVQFFAYKQSIDAARFDHYHPRIAKALAKIAREEARANLSASGATPNASAATSAATGSAGSPTDQAQQLTAPDNQVTPVPEPASYLLTITMAGYALWVRRRRA